MDEKLQYIYSLYPHAQCELHYQTIFQLLIAVVLSAQTTDARVNQATEKLFLKFPDAHLLKNASLKEVEEIIKSIGMYKVKAKHLLEIAKIIEAAISSSTVNAFFSPQSRITTIPFTKIL